MTTEQAIGEVIRVWGVSAERRLSAVKLLLTGFQQERIVELVNKMEYGEGAVHSAQSNLDEINEVFDKLCKGRELEKVPCINRQVF